jgi:hypothetical protein
MLMADDNATSASSANKSQDVRIVLSMFANGRNECGRRCVEDRRGLYGCGGRRVAERERC